MQLTRGNYYHGFEINDFSRNGNVQTGMKTVPPHKRKEGEILDVSIVARFSKDNYANKLIGNTFVYHMQDNQGKGNPEKFEVNRIVAERNAAHVFIESKETGKKYKYLGYVSLVKKADFESRTFTFKVDPKDFDEALTLRDRIKTKSRKKLKDILVLGKQEQEVVKKYGFGVPEQVSEVVFDYFSELAIPEEEYEEGNINHAIIKIRKRNKALRERVIKERGEICEICQLNLGEMYLSKAVPHVHHKKPLFFTGKTMSGLDDVVVLCPSCHAAIHKNPKKPMSVEELQNIVGAFRF